MSTVWTEVTIEMDKGRLFSSLFTPIQVHVGAGGAGGQVTGPWRIKVDNSSLGWFKIYDKKTSSYVFTGDEQEAWLYSDLSRAQGALPNIQAAAGGTASIVAVQTQQSPTMPVVNPPQAFDKLKSKTKTGHNCKRCNQRNDYAEANQGDGSYVCWECR